MDVLDAAFHTVHNREHGGAQGLAPRVGKTHQALSAEVRGAPGFKFGLVDAMTVQHLTGDYRILYAMATELGQMCIPLPAGVLADKAPCAARISQLAQDFAALMSELVEDLADNRVTDSERDRIEAKSAELVSAIQMMLKHIQLMNAALHRETVE